MVQLTERPVSSRRQTRVRRGRTLAPAPLLVVAGVLATGLTALATATGSTPGPLLLVAAATLVLAVGQRTRWPLALALSVLGLLDVVAVAMYLFPILGVPLVVGDTCLLVLVSLASLGVVWWQRRTLRLPGRSGLLLAAASGVVPTLGLLTALLIELRAHGDKLAWAMANDNTFNVIIARFVVDDRGLDLARHFNVAPLASEFAAMFMAPGRAALAPELLMQHDIQRAIQSLLLLLAVMSVVGSVLVAQAVPSRYPLVRSVLAVAVGVLPWTWFIGGYAISYGFWNAVLAGTTLVATWLAWVEAPRSPRLGSAAQALAAAAFVTVWVPLVLLPAAFGVAVVLRFWRTHLAMRRLTLVTWLLPVLTFVGFVYVLTRPTVVPAGGAGGGSSPVSALAFDGAFFAFAHSTPVVIAVLTLGAALVAGSVGRAARWDLLGVVLVVLLGWAGLHYLMGLRATNPTGPWGYYPQKFGWLLCVLAPYAAARGLVTLMQGNRLPALARSGTALGALLVAASLVAQVPPADNRPPSSEGNPAPRPAPDYRLSTMVFLTSVSLKDGASDFDRATGPLFRWSSPREKVLASGWFHDGSLDGFVNFWLLQQTLGTGFPAVRPYAYSLDSRDAASLCVVIGTWGGGVTLKTRQPDLQRRMRKACPDGDYTVDYVKGGLVPTPAA